MSEPDHGHRERPSGTAHLQWRSLGLVASGGVLGAPARYAISQALPNSSHDFPVATLIANLSSALVLGALLEALARRGPDEVVGGPSDCWSAPGSAGRARPTGTFAVDTDQLLRVGRVGLAVVYVVATVLVGLIATGVGSPWPPATIAPDRAPGTPGDGPGSL